MTAETVEIEITKHPDPRIKAEIDSTIQSEFGHVPIVQKYKWSQPDWTIYVLYGGKLTSFLSLVDRTALIDDKKLKLAGFNNVITLPSWRNQGLSTSAMNAAHLFAFKKLDAEFGLLLCANELIPFYAKLGWRVVQCTLLFDQPNGKTQWNSNVMVLSKNGCALKAQTIDLCGLPW